MRKNNKPDTPPRDGPVSALTPDGPALLALYGDELEGENMSDAEKEAFLVALYQVMQAFVDLGFNNEAWEKIGPNRDIDIDDVLEYLALEDTAHEKVAPPRSTKKK